MEVIQRVSSSIFDDVQVSSSVQSHILWSKDLPENIAKLDVLEEGEFEFSSSITKTKKKRRFFLTENLVYFSYIGEDTSIKGVLKLSWVRCEYYQDLDSDSGEERYSIRFIKNKRFTTLFTSSLALFSRWRIMLSNLTIQSDFEANFEITNFLGKGRYAKVSRALLTPGISS